MTKTAAGASPVDRTVRPGAEARWYCLDRDGVAMLCKDEADARAQVIENNDCWPARAPHRVALLCDLEYPRDGGGDFIPLAQPRNKQAKRTAELCLSAWATARMDALEAENAALKREDNALRLYVSDLTAVMLRMVAGIDHLAELARQWEPDHSSGADRRGWVLAKDARDDAWRLLQEHAQRIGPNAELSRVAASEMKHDD